jgi:hypothetical protein
MTLMTDPAAVLQAITPSDTTNIGPARGFIIGVAGTVAVQTKGMSAPVTLTGLATGIVHPISARFIFATGTTATSIVAVY